MMASDWRESVNAAATSGCAATQRPAKSAPTRSTSPIALASSTCPGRIQRRWMPISSAIGIVSPIVTTPHGLDASALTTTSASTAISTTIIPRIATSAVVPRDWPDLVARHGAERAAVATHRSEEDDEILHGAAEHDSDDDPDRAGEKAELRRERGADERTRTGDRREVVAEDDPAIRRQIVAAVLHAHGRCRAAVVDGEDLRRDEAPVEPIRDRVRAERGRKEPSGADGLAAREREAREGAGAEQGDGDPGERRHETSHGGRICTTGRANGQMLPTN